MEDDKVVFKLKNLNVQTATIDELRDLVQHLQDKMNNVYMYWVGEWANGHRARSTRDGQTVNKEEVINYLQ